MNSLSNSNSDCQKKILLSFAYLIIMHRKRNKGSLYSLIMVGGLLYKHNLPSVGIFKGILRVTKSKTEVTKI